ncbi:MAG TPA: response regulator transcription factor [Ktedonobacteraceae bacterium]|nr:response regulator transcription factor [Ktedonobacteraceae bacterium]
MKSKNKCILVIDDELPIQRILRRTLAMDGYTTLLAETGEQAIEMVRTRRPDIILLDLCLPGELNGFEVCRYLRTQVQTPIIVISALTEDKQKVEALDLGADDYLTKPFSNDELLARVRACLRRASAPEATVEGSAGQFQILRSDDGYLSMDVQARQVRAGDKDVRLTPTEFELLRQFMLYAGKVLTHRSLLRAVWGPEYGDEADYLRVYVRQLRRKVELDPSRPRYILTEPGVGYVFRGNVVTLNS